MTWEDRVVELNKELPKIFALRKQLRAYSIDLTIFGTGRKTVGMSYFNSTMEAFEFAVINGNYEHAAMMAIDLKEQFDHFVKQWKLARAWLRKGGALDYCRTSSNCNGEMYFTQSGRLYLYVPRETFTGKELQCDSSNPVGFYRQVDTWVLQGHRLFRDWQKRVRKHPKFYNM